jgi:hypothetical protein
MPGGGHRFEFVGKEPLAFCVAASLLFVNTALMLTLDFGGKYFFRVLRTYFAAITHMRIRAWIQ